MKYELTSKRLIKAMNDKDIMPIELARASGVSKASISHYMTGLHAPSNIAAGKLAKVLEVSPVWLMGFNIDPVDDYDKKMKELAEQLTDKQKGELMDYAEYLVSKNK